MAEEETIFDPEHFSQEQRPYFSTLVSLLHEINNIQSKIILYPELKQDCESANMQICDLILRMAQNSRFIPNYVEVAKLVIGIKEKLPALEDRPSEENIILN